MPEINDEGAIKLALEYYCKFTSLNAEKVVDILGRLDITGLLIYIYDQAVRDTEAEENGAYL